MNINIKIKLIILTIILIIIGIESYQALMKEDVEQIKSLKFLGLVGSAIFISLKLKKSK